MSSTPSPIDPAYAAPAQAQTLEIVMPRGGFDRANAVGAVSASELPALLRRLAPGPFGLTARACAVLEALATAVDTGLAAAAALEGAMLAEGARPGEASLRAPRLSPEQVRLRGAFQIAVTIDRASAALSALCPAPAVEGAFDLEGIDELMAEPSPPRLAQRVLCLCRAYLEQKPGPPGESSEPDTASGTTLMAALGLLKGAMLVYAKASALRALVQALSRRKVQVAGTPYLGLEPQPVAQAPQGLLPVSPAQIVGNEEFLRAGLRLARDVVGFDFAARRNPKSINPVLFALGSPGCGKTVTAHAIGNYFLGYARERAVAAKFVVVRRTDWASSYQNASAANLIRIFRDEVYGFDGVCGVYWADIDTALASRDSNDLRMEEKQNLGAVFGVFDGTLLPKDGKWFMICDANTLTMDEAAVSRISQNPHRVYGPVEAAHYVRLMRDLMLMDVGAFLPDAADAWQRLGEQAAAAKLSGRAIEAICNNLRARIQDFEYPERYFRADLEERKRIIASLSHPVDEAQVAGSLSDYMHFGQQAEREAERKSFENEVRAVVRQLNASREALTRASTGEQDG